MSEESKILHELKSLKTLLSQLIGTSDLPKKQQFSEEAILAAAKQFRKMAIERGEWVSDDQLGRYVKNVGWRSGKFIRENFQFTAYTTYSHHF